MSETVDPAVYDTETSAVLAQYTQRLVRVAVLSTVIWVGLAVVLAFYGPGSSGQLAGVGFLAFDAFLCIAVVALTWFRVRLRRRAITQAIAAGRAELEANGWRRIGDPDRRPDR